MDTQPMLDAPMALLTDPETPKPKPTFTPGQMEAASKTPPVVCKHPEVWVHVLHKFQTG